MPPDTEIQQLRAERDQLRFCGDKLAAKLRNISGLLGPGFDAAHLSWLLAQWEKAAAQTPDAQSKERNAPAYGK